MTIQELNAKFDNILADINGQAGQTVLVQTASDALALIRKRIQETGVNADGSAYKPYSKSYAKYRKERGRQIGFVDFTFSGRMLGNVSLGQSGEIHAELESQNVAVIRPKSAEETEKLRKNVRMRGKILAVSKEEVKMLQEIYAEGIMNIMKKYGV